MKKLSCLLRLKYLFRLTLQIWYYNVPHTKLAEVKGHQNWVKLTGEYLTFPGGGTQFKHGALHYIDFIQDVSFFIALVSCSSCPLFCTITKSTD
jgi:hypothetical protein